MRKSMFRPRTLSYQVILLLVCLGRSLCLYFNKSSFIEISSFNLSQGFQVTFRTCDGGSLFKQTGSGQNYFELFVVPGVMNFTSRNFTPSSLAFGWKSLSEDRTVHIGKELDQNKPYDVMFAPGMYNSTLSVSIGSVKHSIEVPSSVLNIAGDGNMVLGKGFIGCIQFGDNFRISTSQINSSITDGCPLDSQHTCKKRDCPLGYKGYYCEVDIDDCALLQCNYASTCLDGVNNYTCVCGIAWAGRHCDQLARLLCDEKPCANGGICKHVSDYNNYTCTCVEPYSGRNCTEIMTDPCQSSPCLNNGVCKNITSTYYTCSCASGFKGQRCELNIDECVKADCGAGQCVDGIANYTCNCTGSGYADPHCLDDINECDQSPCLNGTCQNYAGGYTCTCHNGFAGKNCDENIDECETSLCKNGGNCTDLIADYTCRCPVEYSGKSCESRLHECNFNSSFSACSSNPCQHGQCTSLCSPYSISYNCSCEPGWRGVNCDQDINECLNATFCANNSTCKNVDGDFYCQCLDDYIGKYCNVSRGICNPNPCEHGVCVNTSVSSYNCSCHPGWFGVNCSQDLDECANNQAQCNASQTASCKNTDGSYECICKNGFTGTHCNDDVNECVVNNPCLNNGRCENRHGSYECYCKGYFGKLCQSKIDYCSQGGNEACKNSDCISSAEAYDCACHQGWQGVHCTHDINECNLGYCKNNISCNNTMGNYACSCQLGYTGKNCSVDIDECASKPCANNGTCVDHVNDYSCNCSYGFEGKSCDTDIDWCNVTRNNGTDPCIYGLCSDHVLNYACHCFEGFSGENCEVDFDECASSPCQNGGTCVQKSNETAFVKYFGKDKLFPKNERGGYLCVCPRGYNGSDCEHDIDECQVLRPCNTTGTSNCIHLIDDYNCTCKPGFQGRNCSEDIDECASNPCLNNATCSDLVASYRCNCSANYTGERCEKEQDPCTMRSPCKNGATCHVTSDLNYTCSCAEGYAGTACTQATTMAFTETSTMTITLPAQSFDLSFSFQTIFSEGVLVEEPSKWMMALHLASLEIIWQDNVLFTIGSGLSDSRWHNVTFLISPDSIYAEIDPETCSQHCWNRSAFPSSAHEARRSARATETSITVGATLGASGRPNFIGSIRDITVDNVTYYPGVGGVNVTNVIENFQRQNVCTPNPCVNGKCSDLWSRYTCECDRNWTSTNCTEEVLWGTFGAISRLNNGYNSTSNQSYAKYSFSTTQNLESLSFSVRTTSQSSVIVLLKFSASVYLSIETSSHGSLRIRHNHDVVDVPSKIADSAEHYIRVNRSTVYVDDSPVHITLPTISIQDVYVGGLAAHMEMTSTAPFQGCIRDVRLNGEQLLFFNQAAYSKLNVVQINIAMDCSSEDVCRQLSGSDVSPCRNSGNCTDLWNQYNCTCPWPYGGDNCELYGCQWRTFCPQNTTCMNVKGKAAFECLTEVTFNGSQSSAFFTNSTPFSNIRFLVIQFRTLQNSTGLLASSGDKNTMFEVAIANGRLLVSYHLNGNLTGVINVEVFVSSGKWHELTVVSTENTTKFTVSEIQIQGSELKYLAGYSLLRNISILNNAFSDLLSTSEVHLGSPLNQSHENLSGCLRVVRFGNNLLSFLDNSTMLDTRPGFSHSTSAFTTGRLGNVISGCHSNPVCTDSVCGAGKCIEVWNDFSCECPPGFHGERCQDTPCSSSPCTHGDCIVSGNAYTCSCADGFVGLTCNESCANYACENDGECVIENKALKCACASEWTGEHCQYARPSDDDDQLPLIVGLSVAGGIILLIVVVIICCCTRQTSSTFGTYSPRNEEKVGARVEMNNMMNVPPPEKLI